MKPYEVLLEQNPWWKGKEQIKEDYDIKKWKKKKTNWKPQIINQINLKPWSFNILVGPRQVGKTTAIKLLIKKILKGKTEEIEKEKQVFYFNCEEINDYKELIELIKTYLDIKKAANIEKSHLFLDEVTSVEKWQKGIKSLIDKGKLQENTLTITGSMSLKIKKKVELFPGRRGKGKNLLMHPLSFRRFIEVQDPELIEKIPKINNLSKEELTEKASQAMPFSTELKEYLEKYFHYGGLPLSVASIGQETERKRAKEAYLDHLKTDILELGKDNNRAREIISSILQKMPSHFSWNKISKETPVKSPKTVESYIKTLQDMYSLIILHHLDLSTKTMRYGKNKKVHVTDPLFLEIFEDWALINLEEKKNILAESCVANHLARFTARGLEPQTGLGYWKNGREIDLIVKRPQKEKTYGFEVKWSNRIKKQEEYLKQAQHLEHLTFLLKDKYQTQPLSIPLAIFLALI